MALTVLVTGASSGFGRMIARDLAFAGHTVYASMRGTDGRNADQVMHQGDDEGFPRALD